MDNKEAYDYQVEQVTSLTKELLMVKFELMNQYLKVLTFSDTLSSLIISGLVKACEHNHTANAVIWLENIINGDHDDNDKELATSLLTLVKDLI